MLTIKQLLEAGLPKASVTVRGHRIEISPMPAARNAELMGLFPSPDKPSESATHDEHAAYRRAYSRWVLAVELAEFAVLTGFLCEIPSRGGGEIEFPWKSDDDTKLLWLEEARRQLGGSMTRAEIQDVLRAADAAARGPAAEAARGN